MLLRYTLPLFALTLLGSLAPDTRAQQPGDIVITEVLVNPGGTIFDTNGEWFELYNNTNQPINLQNWFVRDSSAAGLRPLHQISASLVVPAYGFVVLGNTTNTTNNGGAIVDYAYGSALALANSLDAIHVVAPDGVTVIDRVKYATATVSAQNGISRELVDVTMDNYLLDGPNWVNAQVTSVYGEGGRGTPCVAGQTGGVLPVELVSFRAVAAGSGVSLTWETASETNNAGFEVEHRAGTSHFRTLSFVAGRGTTAEASTYRFTTAGLQPGTHVFRLRQVDFDGAFEYSPEVEVRVAPEAGGWMSAYPNPFRDQARLTLHLSSSDDIRLSVYDMLGREVSVLHEGLMEAGEGTFTLDGHGLPAGLYVIRAQGVRFTSIQHVTLVR